MAVVLAAAVVVVSPVPAAVVVELSELAEAVVVVSPVSAFAVVVAWSALALVSLVPLLVEGVQAATVMAIVIASTLDRRMLER